MTFVGKTAHLFHLPYKAEITKEEKMKSTVGRKVLLIAITCMCCLPIMGRPYVKVRAEQTASETGKSEKEKITQLLFFLEGREKNADSGMDINKDKKINAVDLTLAKRQILSNSAETKSRTVTTTTALATKATTTTKENTESEYDIIKDALKKNTITDTKIPAYKGTLYEDKDNVYLFQTRDTVYAYTLLTSSKELLSTGKLMTENDGVQGMHIWLYKGSQSEFLFEEGVVSEALVPYGKIGSDDILKLSGILTGAVSSTTIVVSKYDYNANKKLDNDDLRIMLQNRTANPKSFFKKINNNVWNIFFDELPRMTTFSNFVLEKNSQATPVMYTFCIPTGGINNPDYTGVVSDFPVQVLPIDLESTITAKYEEDPFASDKNHNFLVWEPLFKSWAYGSNTSPTNWEFKGGIHAYLLDSNGEMVKKWIE